MKSEDKGIPKVIGSDSSSAMSTPVEKIRLHDTAKDQQILQEFLKSYPKKELVRSNLDKERKHGHLSKCKLTEVSKSTGIKGPRNLESKKLSNHSTSTNNHTSKKPQRKGDNPVRLPSSTESQVDSLCSKNWVCTNSACKAVLNSGDAFCKRCSCCICHLFDDNKDPSLWLVCTSESGDRDWCGLSCHIECALQHQKVGVVDLGQVMQLDGSYCCASCGKVSGIISSWKKQLAIAKDARRVDVLCYRIFLSYRLLHGTSRFKELHEIVEEAKEKLEAEVGPADGVSANMARGIVGRLSVASDVQRLCSVAIGKAGDWLSINPLSDQKLKGSLPAACKFLFDEITSSSLVIVLRDTCSAASDVIKGYKLWYCKSSEQPYKRDPIVFPKAQRRIIVSSLQPCTEYAFHIISFTEDGDLGHSESKCFTKSVEVIHKHTEHNGEEGCSSSVKRDSKTPVAGPGFRVRNLGKILRLTWAQEEGCYDSYCKDDLEEESSDGTGALKLDSAEEGLLELDLNVASVPDLNAELVPVECSPEGDNGCSSEKNGEVRSSGSGDSQTCTVRPVGEVPAVESRPDCRKRLAIVQEEPYDGGSTLVDGSPLRFSNSSGQLDDCYEYCVKVIRSLECSGHIDKGFRMKFLTWFSLRSTEQERRVVITFIRTLIEDPSSLADQLLDSFTETVACKRPKNGFCSKLCIDRMELEMGS